MFGSSILGGISTLESLREYLCAAFAVGCLAADPEPAPPPVPEPTQPEVTVVVPVEPAPSGPSTPSSSPAQPVNDTPVAVTPPPTVAPASTVTPAATPAPSQPAAQVTQPTPQPVRLTMRAEPSQVARGQSAKIVWQAENASNCTASGGWSGNRAVNGSTYTGALNSATEYRLSCSSVGGSGALAQVTVDVRQSQPIRLSFTAKPQRVSPGGSSELQWSAQNADSCVAEGGWRGSRDRAGRFETGRLSRTVSYTIRCSNADYEEVAILQVRVNRFALEWRPPTRNVDGSLAQDIDGYRVYWGKNPGRYTGSVTISSPDVTRWEPDLGPGTYFFAVSAFDRAGNESEKSAPLRKVID